MAEVRLVAVDEDGTFLRDHAHYDRMRFARIWDAMQIRGVRFVVATGNQCYQVQGHFAPYVSDIGIVSANGAYVLDGTTVVFAAEAAPEAVRRMISACHERPETPFSMLGVAGAYVERTCSQAFFDDMALYCTRQEWVDDYREVVDQVFMFSSVVEEERVASEIAYYRTLLGDMMDVVGSGEGYFDVVCPGVTKATGLTHLLERWDIAPEECIAFGDSDNDLAMLQLVGCGYAMANAPEHVREAADAVAPPNTEDGVLAVLEDLFC